MAAQFFSSLADNALLIAAIALLRGARRAARGCTPALKQMLRRCPMCARAPGGRVRRLDAQGSRDADHQRDQVRRLRVHPVPTSIRCSPTGWSLAGRSGVFAGQVRDPDRAAAARRSSWSPTAGSRAPPWLHHPRQVLGGALISPRVSTVLLGFDLPLHRHWRSTPRLRPRSRSSWPSTLIAAVINWFIPNTGVDHRVPSKNPLCF